MTIFKLIVAVGIALTSINSFATGECIDITTDSKRLACYDSKYMPVVKDTSSTLSKGSWDTSTEKSAKNDNTNAYAIIQSSNTFRGRWGDRNSYARLHIHCRENSTQFYITLGKEHLVSSDYNSYGTVGYRIDDRKLSKWRMTESTDNKALGLWNGSGIGQIKTLLGAKKLQAWVTPYNESEKHIIFDVTGIDEALKDVRKNCNW